MSGRHTFRKLMGLMVLLTLSACGGGGGGDTVSQGSTPPTLSKVIADLQSDLLGFNVAYTAPGDTPPTTSGTLNGSDTYSISMLGMALCIPADPYAAPDPLLVSGITTIYGCDNNLTVSYAVPAPSTLSLTLTIPAGYMDISGSFTLLSIPYSFQGYAAATDITATVELTIIANGDGTYRVDTSIPPNVSIDYNTLTIDTDNTSLDILISAGTLVGFDAYAVSMLEAAIASELQLKLSSAESFVF